MPCTLNSLLPPAATADAAPPHTSRPPTLKHPVPYLTPVAHSSCRCSPHLLEKPNPKTHIPESCFSTRSNRGRSPPRRASPARRYPPAPERLPSPPARRNNASSPQRRRAASPARRTGGGGNRSRSPAPPQSRRSPPGNGGGGAVRKGGNSSRSPRRNNAAAPSSRKANSRSRSRSPAARVSCHGRCVSQSCFKTRCPSGGHPIKSTRLPCMEYIYSLCDQLAVFNLALCVCGPCAISTMFVVSCITRPLVAMRSEMLRR